MSPTWKAFLDLVGWSEGTSTSPLTKNQGYDVIVTGIHGPSIFDNYSQHPFELGGSVQWQLDPPKFSTAAGRYQVLARYWRVYKAQLHLSDFSPQNQDTVALQQIKERGGLLLLDAGNIREAIDRCSNIWASFPGNDYGQGGKSVEALLAQYQMFLGQ
jgi:muramidase (phage lysozyme)